MGSLANINEMRTYYNGLSLLQKREFLVNLERKLKGQKNSKYKEFLKECIEKYNRDARERNSSSTLNQTKSSKQPRQTISSNLSKVNVSKPSSYSAPPSRTYQLTCPECGSYELHREANLMKRALGAGAESDFVVCSKCDRTLENHEISPFL